MLFMVCEWGRQYSRYQTTIGRGYDEGPATSGACGTPQKRGVATSGNGRRENADGVHTETCAGAGWRATVM